MIWIPICIVCCALLVVFFKIERWISFDTDQVIIFNYIFAAIPFWFKEKPSDLSPILEPFFLGYFAVIGLFFISIFLFIGYGVKAIGATKVVLAQKLSFIIPVSISILLYSELLSPFLWIGIGLSILSIFLITSSKSTEKKTNSTAFWYILIIWLGSGIVDSIIKITTIQAGSLKDWVSDGIYQSCMIFSIIYLLYLLLFKKKKLHWTSIGLGLILGFINYFSLYAFVQSNALRNIAASVFFPINNMGIIIFTSLFSVLLFKEELGKKALWGLGLGILGILAILYHAL